MRRFATWIAVATALAVVGFAVGYRLSTGWGHELLRQEVESLLSDLMEGEVEIDDVRIVLSRGIGLEGHGVRVYPRDDGGPGGPGHALRAERAYIELNEPALAIGQFELSLLVVEDPVFEISFGEDGRWSFAPLQAVLDRESSVEADSAPDPDARPERATPVLDTLADAERVARALLEDIRIADRLVVQRGTVTFEDHSASADARPGTPLQRFQLEQIEGILSRPWLSDEGQLALTATLVSPDGTESPVRCTSFVEDGALEIAMAGMDLELSTVSAYVQRLSRKADVDGTMSGELRLYTAEPGYQHVLADFAIQQVAPTVVLADEPARIEVPMEVLRAQLEVEPTVARLIQTRLGGSRASLEFEANVERPITWDAEARIRAELGGMTVKDVLPIVDSMPEGSALIDWFDRIESGTVDRLSLAGRTSFSTWGQLLDGELAHLPPGFLLGLVASKVTARLDENEPIVDASFQAEWAADRLELRKGRATWQGEVLPEINITVDGLSNFVGLTSSEFETNAEPLPGLPLLLDFIQRDGEEGGAADYRFHVDFDYIDHPIVRWPAEDGQVTIQSIPNGTESVVSQATWGGLPVVAEVIYLLEPEPVITVGVQASRAPARIDHEQAAPKPARHALGPWGRGTFRLQPRDVGAGEPPAPLSQMRGAFTLSKSTVRLSNVDLTVSSNAHITADVAVDLGDAEVLPVALQGRLDDADFDEIGPAIGLPEGFVTGRVNGSADVTGHLERGKNPFSGLSGTIRGSARKGTIQQKVPLAVKMAAATDGFNPFAKQDTLEYDTIETEILLDDGRLTAKRLELEGPVRIYATGSLDFSRPPQQLDAVVGVFLFQRIRELLGMVPLVNLVVPGTNNGLVGAYFRVQGPWDDPSVETMKLKSLKEELPGIISAPVDFIQWLWKSGRGLPASP